MAWKEGVGGNYYGAQEKHLQIDHCIIGQTSVKTMPNT